jgi:hypothetical protein
MTLRRVFVGFAAIAGLLAVSGCNEPEPGTVKDEAMLAKVDASAFKASSVDFFHDMDGGIKLSPAEVRGRNTWIVWTGGNDRFWDYMANNTFGAFDLLKILSSNPKVGYCIDPKKEPYGRANYGRHDPQHDFEYSQYSNLDEDACAKNHGKWFTPNRSNRFYWYGLINEPCFEQAKGPDEYGLWLDRPVTTGKCKDVKDPFESEKDYPGVIYKARGTTLPRGSYYGKATGVVGLRLFPNPDFDEAAKKKWMDAINATPGKDAFYINDNFYATKHLIRPYRVGMSCGFCHVGPSPVHPPKDPENPEWANLNSNPGAQYFWVDRVFIWNPQAAPRNFIFQLFHTSLPGSLDTSFVSTDNINNPRTMNAVYGLLPRLLAAQQWKEKLAGGGLDNKQFDDYPQTREATKKLNPAGLFLSPDTVFTPRVLKDGSDSVGALGALNRVYINIGLFSEEWLLHFRALIGGKRITPIKIADAEKNSSYWKATENMTADMALFFLQVQPDKLADTEYGKTHPLDQKKLDRGKTVFAENCARCHSSKQPPNLCMLGTPCKAGQVVENSESYFDWMRKEVHDPGFLDKNFLSTDRRVSIQEMGINACSPLATNALRNDIWDNFSSETYKELPAVGKITVYNPIDGTPTEYDMPGGGRGYVRPASLISVWSSAPYLQNNSVGIFNGDPSVGDFDATDPYAPGAGRLAAFKDGITKMLWPDKRDKDPILGKQIPGPSKILRTTAISCLEVPAGYLPDNLDRVAGRFGPWLHWLAPWLFTKAGDVAIGPIPAGTPVNLLANINPLSESTRPEDRAKHTAKLVDLLLKLKRDLKSLPNDICEQKPKLRSQKELDAINAQARKVFDKHVPELLSASKCPDFIVNKGHYFGTNLSDEDKFSLIEFLKTF